MTNKGGLISLNILLNGSLNYHKFLVLRVNVKGNSTLLNTTKKIYLLRKESINLDQTEPYELKEGIYKEFFRFFLRDWVLWLKVFINLVKKQNFR